MAFALANLFLQLVEKILNSLADEELLEDKCNLLPIALSKSVLFK